MIRSLRQAGHRVAVFPTVYQEERIPVSDSLRKLGAEVYHGGRWLDLVYAFFLLRRRNLFDVIIICRPQNMRALGRYTRLVSPRSKVVYDAEAFFAVREIQTWERKMGRDMPRHARRRLMAGEAGLARVADLVFSVSQAEASLFRRHGISDVRVLSHSVTPRRRAPGFEGRRGMLFVGSICRGSANEDAVEYFLGEVVPLRRQLVEIGLRLVGLHDSPAVVGVHSKGVEVVGPVPKLEHFYDTALVFIAPTRMGAGIPLKVLEAAANGLPAVVTPLLADQLGWTDGVEVLVGRSPSDFAEKCLALAGSPRLWRETRERAWDAVEREFSHQKFARVVSDSVSELSRRGEVA